MYLYWPLKLSRKLFTAKNNFRDKILKSYYGGRKGSGEKREIEKEERVEKREGLNNSGNNVMDNTAMANFVEKCLILNF